MSTLTPAPVSPGCDATVSVLVVRGLLQVLEHEGVQRAAFLAAAGLTEDKLDAHEARVSRTEMFRLCGLALEWTQDPALGLHWAKALNDRMFVPITNLIINSASLGQGFEFLARFNRLLSDDPGYRVVEEGSHVIVQCTPAEGQPPHIQRFASEFMIGGFFRLLRSFGPDMRPALISFEHQAPSNLEEYLRFFGSATRFAQPSAGLVFDRSLLDVASPGKDDDVCEALRAVAERRLLRIGHQMPYADRVRDYLVRQGGWQASDMEHVARALETSVRSLRRRLSDEGKSYNSVLNEALGMVARGFLRDPRRTIQDVAYEMGFSDPSAFHRAFKRWTNTTPSAYRESL